MAGQRRFQRDAGCLGSSTAKPKHHRAALPVPDLSPNHGAAAGPFPVPLPIRSSLPPGAARSPAPRAPGAPLLRSHVASGSPAHRGRVQAEGGGANRGTTARRAEGGVATGGRACAIEPGNGAEGAGGARRKARGEDWGESKGTERPGRGRKTAGTAPVRKGGRKGRKGRRKEGKAFCAFPLRSGRPDPRRSSGGREVRSGAEAPPLPERPVTAWGPAAPPRPRSLLSPRSDFSPLFSGIAGVEGRRGRGGPGGAAEGR